MLKLLIYFACRGTLMAQNIDNTHSQIVGMRNWERETQRTLYIIIFTVKILLGNNNSHSILRGFFCFFFLDPIQQQQEQAQQSTTKVRLIMCYSCFVTFIRSRWRRTTSDIRIRIIFGQSIECNECNGNT